MPCGSLSGMGAGGSHFILQFPLLPEHPPPALQFPLLPPQPLDPLQLPLEPPQPPETSVGGVRPPFTSLRL